jgi:hypothetical protein
VPSPQLQQRALAGLLFGLLSMFGLFAFSDLIGQLGDLRRTALLVGFSLFVGAISLWLGITAVTRSRRAATARPRGAASAIVLGSIGVLFSILLLALFAVMSKEFSQYSRCMKGANTLAAQEQCHDQLTRALHAETRALREGR